MMGGLGGPDENHRGKERSEWGDATQTLRGAESTNVSLPGKRKPDAPLGENKGERRILGIVPTKLSHSSVVSKGKNSKINNLRGLQDFRQFRGRKRATSLSKGEEIEKEELIQHGSS